MIKINESENDASYVFYVEHIFEVLQFFFRSIISLLKMMIVRDIGKEKKSGV